MGEKQGLETHLETVRARTISDTLLAVLELGQQPEASGNWRELVIIKVPKSRAHPSPWCTSIDVCSDKWKQVKKQTMRWGVKWSSD